MEITPLTAILKTFVVNEQIHEFTVTEDWLQGRTIYGGIIAALANDSIRRILTDDRPLRAIQIVYGGPNPAGPLRLEPVILREGKAVTLARCTISSNNQITTTVTAVYGAARESMFNIKPQPIEVPMIPEQLADLDFFPGLTPPFMLHYQQRWAIGALPYSNTADSNMSAYARYRGEDADHLSEAHVLALMDNIPPPILALLDKPVPASTMSWSIEILEHTFDFKMDEWWRVDAVVDAAADGYVVHTSHIINPAGKIAAISRQVVVVYG